MINCHTTNKKKRHYNMFSKSTSTINTNNIYIYKTSTICTLYNRLTYYITIIFDRNSLLVKNYSIYILYIKKKKKTCKDIICDNQIIFDYRTRHARTHVRT